MSLLVIILCFITVGGRFGNLEQRRVGVHVPDLEPGEVDAVGVGLGRAEVVLRDVLQLEHGRGAHLR